MPNEGALKTRWTKWARRQDLFVKPMGPHQIAGLPDLLVIDKGESEVIGGFGRVKQNWVEAKPLHAGPSAFKAKRDASPNQVKWLKWFAALGTPTWWLILSSDGWMLIDGREDTLTREAWQKGMRKYGAKITQLIDADSQRKELVGKRQKLYERIEQAVLRMFPSKA